MHEPKTLMQLIQIKTVLLHHLVADVADKLSVALSTRIHVDD